jgi:hypothetical protein
MYASRVKTTEASQLNRPNTESIDSFTLTPHTTVAACQFYRRQTWLREALNDAHLAPEQLALAPQTTAASRKADTTLECAYPHSRLVLLQLLQGPGHLLLTRLFLCLLFTTSLSSLVLLYTKTSLPTVDTYPSSTPPSTERA